MHILYRDPGNSRDYIIQITSLSIVYMIVIVLYLSNCTIHRWRKHFCLGGGGGGGGSTV